MTRPISVLIVDDHPVVRRGLRVLLEVQDGIEVAGEAGDGATALALAAELTPDVILLDLKLPGMDGLAVLAELKARAGTGSSRVLVLTSVTEPASASLAVRSGAAGVLYKDVDPDALVRAIRSVHDGHLLLASEAAGPLGGHLGSRSRPGLAHRSRARGTCRTHQGPVQPGDRASAWRLGEDGQGARELGASQARRAGPHPGRPARGQAPAVRFAPYRPSGWLGGVRWHRFGLVGACGERGPDVG